MKKNYLLWIFLMFITSITVSRAQSWSLQNVTAEQFASGGTDEWSFERHDVNAGIYGAFENYDNSSFAVNYYDQYLTERFNLYPIMNRPASGTQYEEKRFAWYTDKTASTNNEFVYIAHEYEDGITIGDNLIYGTNYPDTLLGYEVYSNSKGINAAVTFTVPETGYYRANMKVIRQDLWSSIGAMKVYQFFRYDGEGDGYSMGKEFSYGISPGIDSWAAGNETLYAEHLAKIPEFPTVNGNSGKPYRGLPTGSTSEYFCFYAKKGDKISFEADARSTGNGESTPRGAYARTKWIDLTIEVTDEATATADVSRYANPYLDDPDLLTELYNKLDEAEMVISNNLYSKASRDALEALYTLIDQRLADGAVKSMEMPALITQLQHAIELCLASESGLKLRYTFDNVVDNIVPDLSNGENNGTLHNNASIKTCGKYNFLDLGSDNGYLDMGANIGNSIAGLRDYTISSYYRIDTNAPFSGNGFMLFAFSTLEANSSGSGEYIFYRMPTQEYAISAAGWSNGSSINVNAAAKKGEWQHVVIQQKEGVCTIYVNGEAIKSGEFADPADKYTMSPEYNWIGRPPFGGDNYLKQTMVYDFSIYNYAVPADSISKWAGLVSDLEYATNHSDDGDYSVLDALIAEYTSIVENVAIGSEAGQFSQEVVDAFKGAIAGAQAISTAHISSQIKIDAEVELLKAAYATFISSVSVLTNSLAEGQYYISINDEFYMTNPGAASIANGQNLKISNNGLSTTQVTSDYTQVWKLSFVTALDPARYSLYSELNEEGVFRHLTENTVVQATWGGSDNNWRTYNILFNGEAYAIQNMGSSASKGYWRYDETNQQLTYGATSPQFIFRFIPFTGLGLDNKIDSGKTLVCPIPGAIQVTTEEAVTVTVYTFSGATVASKALAPGSHSIPVQNGLYIVKTQGQTSTASKVVVR